MELKQEEIKNLIALEMRNKKLNNFLNLNDITERVMKHVQESEQFKNIIPEMNNMTVQKISQTFPQEEQPSPEINQQQNINVLPGEENKLEQPVQPTIGYIPELPEVLKNAEPGELIVFDYNEITNAGQNLTDKTFRTFEDPELRKSMHDLWISEGKTKADIYITKFEKIGELSFNYTNGTTQFVEKTDQVDLNPSQGNDSVNIGTPAISSMDSNQIIQIIKDTIQDTLSKGLGGMDKKENVFLSKPSEDNLDWIRKYAPDWKDGDPIPSVETFKQFGPNALELHKKALDILQKFQDTNTGNSSSLEPKRSDDFCISDIPKNERITDNHNNPEEIGYVVSESVTLNDLIKINTDFVKVDTPKEIVEALEGKRKNVETILETSEVKGWIINGKEFYLPANYLSNRKCYTKNKKTL